MPESAARPCAGCGRPGHWPRGKCAACRSHTEKARRGARGFDYSAKWWRWWRTTYLHQQVQRGLPVACQTCGEGTSHDRSSLHLHHEPELTEVERAAIQAGQRAIACDETRIVLLCRSCHSALTNRRHAA